MRKTGTGALNIGIREERPTDVSAIEAVTVAAFLNAPHTDHTEQFIVSALRKAGALSVSLVAEVDGEIIGHVAVSPVTISSGATGWFGLGPLSVDPKAQRQGVGSALVEAALSALRTRGASGCVLVGDPAYYARFGFQPVPDFVFPEVSAEYFQAISFGQPFPRGSVSYHAAFNARS